MKTHYLKFSDEAEAVAALSDCRGVDETGAPIWITSSHAHALDVIGTIYKPTGAMQTGDDGESYPEIAALPGYHVNLAIDVLPDALVAFEVAPTQPVRMFA